MLNIAINENLPQNNEWHFIPAAFVSPQETFIPNAKVSNYFTPSIKEGPKLTASLHGHLL